MRVCKLILGAVALLSTLGSVDARTLTPAGKKAHHAEKVFDAVKADSPAELRRFLQAFPKGGDIHNHLTGAIYAENYIAWAAEDGFCADMSVPRLVYPDTQKSCKDRGFIEALQVEAKDEYRRRMINSLSNRSWVKTLDWSGHKDFFVTFERMARAPYRLGDMLAEVAARAGRQNIVYLELMETIILPELFGLASEVEMTGDAATDYAALMASSFGENFETLKARAGSELREALARKDLLLGCSTGNPDPGCQVQIRMIHQVIRSFPPAVVNAQIILGWAVMEDFDNWVGLNLVAPEDGFVALRDYSRHMQMIDHLYRTQGPQNVTLHAGELVMGLVMPKELRFHIRDAIAVGHAKRIGHGIDIAYEDDSAETLARMRDEGIMVEINLTSNHVILGVDGDQHPLSLYRRAGVPWALSTDDEGVSRLDLTHEYMRGVTDQGLTYRDLKSSSRNSLTYSFLPGESLWDQETCRFDLQTLTGPSAECAEILATSVKAQAQWDLEMRFRRFEDSLKLPSSDITAYN